MYRRLTFLFLGLLLAGTIVGIIVPAGPGWDFANFYDTGRRMAVGQISDLYHPESLIAAQPPQGKLGFYGAPISALLYAPLAWFSPTWAMVLFKIENTIAYFIALLVLYLHNRSFAESDSESQWRFAALFSGLTLVYQPFWTVYRVGGQTTPTVFLLLALAMVCHVRLRFFLSALFVVGAVLIKPAFIFAPALLVCVSGWKFFKQTVVVSALVAAISIPLLGWPIHAEFIQVMARASQESYPWFYNSSIYVVAENIRILANAGQWNDVLKLSTIAVKVAALAICVYALIKSRTLKLPEPARRHFEFLTAIVLCVLVAQTVWEHYLVALFPLLIYIAAARHRFRTATLGLATAIFLLAAWQNLILISFLRAHSNFSTIPELILIGLIKSAPLTLTAFLLLRLHQDMFQSYKAPAWSHVNVREVALT